MREFSKISTRLWASLRFKNLPDFERMIYVYFLANRHANSVGAYQCSADYVAIDTKRDATKVRNGIKALHDAQLIFYNWPEESVTIPNWIKFNQPSNPNHARKVTNDALALPDLPEKALVIFEILRDAEKIGEEDREKLIREYDILCERYGYRIDTVSSLDKTLTETETETIPLGAELDFGDAPDLIKTVASEFEEFWQTYPKLRSKGSKKNAKAQYDKKRKSHSHAVIQLGAENYAAYCEATGQNNKDAERFLRDDLFLDDWTIPERARGNNISVGDLKL